MPLPLQSPPSYTISDGLLRPLGSHSHSDFGLSDVTRSETHLNEVGRSVDINSPSFSPLENKRAGLAPDAAPPAPVPLPIPALCFQHVRSPARASWTPARTFSRAEARAGGGEEEEGDDDGWWVGTCKRRCHRGHL
ncbi:hypothetical protein L3Q82_003903 [Scortum barcoo]|uniref:Uncharacterized protein n=1 Tax=Scortum barcoo TaxID=214431 RepID=A0ACB8X6C3_9TELE|nr:hypothetical protein L3Q82_003903 [Scortum barcoo]